MPITPSWDKLTSTAKEAVQAANYLASKRGNGLMLKGWGRDDYARRLICQDVLSP